MSLSLLQGFECSHQGPCHSPRKRLPALPEQHGGFCENEIYRTFIIFFKMYSSTSLSKMATAYVHDSVAFRFI